MSANTASIFIAKPQVGHQISPATATTNTSGTSLANTKTLLSAAVDGTRLDYIRAVPIATFASAIKLNVFLVNATNYYLFDEITFAATTVTTTSVDQPWEKFYEGVVLQTGMTLEFTVTTAAGTSAVSVTAFGWDYTP